MIGSARAACSDSGMGAIEGEPARQMLNETTKIKKLRRMVLIVRRGEPNASATCTRAGCFRADPFTSPHLLEDPAAEYHWPRFRSHVALMVRDAVTGVSVLVEC